MNESLYLSSPLRVVRDDAKSKETFEKLNPETSFQEALELAIYIRNNK